MGTLSIDKKEYVLEDKDEILILTLRELTNVLKQLVRKLHGNN